MEALRHSIKEPIAAIFQAWRLLNEATDAHLRGDFKAAEASFRNADLPEVWHWGNPAAGPSPGALRLNVRNLTPEGDTRAVPINDRASRRDASRETKAAVLARDGYRCRYCGIPVVPADIRKLAHALYPEAVPWIDGNEKEQHAAFQCFWLQFDHVVPYSHGGSSLEDNIVATCYLCNFGKDKYTLKQLDVTDPRNRRLEPVDWDGLLRLRGSTAPTTRESPKSPEPHRLEAPAEPAASPSPLSVCETYFIPGAWISSGYLYTPPINGKSRWFKLGPNIRAEPTVLDGAAGCHLSCGLSELQRRGLSLDPLPKR